MSLNRLVHGGDEKEEDSAIRLGTIYNTNSSSADDIRAVFVDIGDGLIIAVPKSFTQLITDGNRTYPALITIPARDGAGSMHNIETLLEEKSGNNAISIPESVTFDQEMFDKKSAFFENVLTAHEQLFASGKYPNAKAALENLSSKVISESLAKYIKIKASSVSLAINDPEPELHGQSLAVDAHSKFGPAHRLVLCDSVFTMGFSQGINTGILSNPGVFKPIDAIMIPFTACVQNVKNHPPVNGQWFSMNRRGVPTFLMYSAAAATTWVSNVYLQAYCADRMHEQNYSNTSIRLAAGAAAIGVGVAVKIIYRYSPSVSTLSRSAKKAGNCLYSAGSLLKSCGMKLWNCRSNNNENTNAVSPDSVLSRPRV